MMDPTRSQVLGIRGHDGSHTVASTGDWRQEPLQMELHDV